MEIGFIGLGNMGKPMAKNLCKAGYSLIVNDLNREAVAELVAMGAQEAQTPAGLAKNVDVLITMLPNEAIVRQVIMGETGILQGAAEGLCLIDMSSVSPEFSRQMAANAEKQGLAYMDAPVSGGVKGAEGGRLTIMVGGKESVIQKCRPVLEVLGEKIYEVGAIGSGDAVKMINNMLLAVNMAAAAEAFVLGQKIGLDPQKMLDIIGESSGSSYALQAKMPNFVFKGEFAPGFMIDLQQKDLELAIQSAKKQQVPFFMAALAQQVYSQAQSAGFGREDISAVIKPLENLTKTTVRVCKK